MLSGGIGLKIGFAGAGKVGRALGLYFRRYGLELSGYCSRTFASARSAAELTGSRAYPTLRELIEDSGVVFLTVPDDVLGRVDAQAAEAVAGMSGGPVFVHVSGALSALCLERLAAAGRPVGSMHPLQSFGEAAGSAERLDKALFTLEGDEKAVRTVREILERTGGRMSSITAEQKPLYHAGACVVSNYLVTLVDGGLRCFEAAGVSREYAMDAVIPLVEATLANIRAVGTVNALTGPIVRGDCNTVSVHLRALREGLPAQLELYRAMAEQTIKMIAGKRLTAQQEEKLYQTIGG